MSGGLRQGLLLCGAAALLVFAFVAFRDGTPGAAAARPSPGRSRAAAREVVPMTDLRLELLEKTPAALEDPSRNPFRFASRSAPPAPAPAVSVPVARVAPPVALPTGPPPLPAIPIRYIGLLDAPTQSGLVAVLSDGKGNIFYGREGDTIEGRYRVIHVSPVATELSYLDGRGRQTIRLSGQ